MKIIYLVLGMLIAIIFVFSCTVPEKTYHLDVKYIDKTVFFTIPDNSKGTSKWMQRLITLTGKTEYTTKISKQILDFNLEEALRTIVPDTNRDVYYDVDSLFITEAVFEKQNNDNTEFKYTKAIGIDIYSNKSNIQRADFVFTPSKSNNLMAVFLPKDGVFVNLKDVFIAPKGKPIIKKIDVEPEVTATSPPEKDTPVLLIFRMKLKFRWNIPDF